MIMDRSRRREEEASENQRLQDAYVGKIQMLVANLQSAMQHCCLCHPCTMQIQHVTLSFHFRQVSDAIMQSLHDLPWSEYVCQGIIS
jgi:hypothetical protein